MADVLKEQKNQKYNEYVKQVTPTHSLPANMAKAFCENDLGSCNDYRDRYAHDCQSLHIGCDCG